MKLLLFDIDGTLVHASAIGTTSIEAALSRIAGRPVSTDGVSFSGKTDPQIVREVLAANDVDASDALIDRALEAYTSLALDTLTPDDVVPCPGARDLLGRLADRSDVHLGLVTGNVEAMAYAKLDAVGFDALFPFGAFGSDHADRDRLPPLAVERAARHTGRSFSGSDVVVIGDTERDIRCGQCIGARTVSVCTGSSSRTDLSAHEPDVLLDSFGDPDDFVFRVLNS
jgi:phosphoglycolate phosphatase-like HAD superfamily hydrolase